MSTIYTFATLFSSIKDWVETENSELNTRLPEIIGLAEDRLVRDLNLVIFDKVGSVTSSGGFLTKPADCIQLRSMSVVDSSVGLNGSFNYLLPRHPDFISDLQGSGVPRYVAEYSDTQWAIAPVPMMPVTARIRYIARPLGLSETNTTTYLSTKFGDCLLYACLMHTEPYLVADDRIAVWTAAYSSAFQSAKNEVMRSVA